MPGGRSALDQRRQVYAKSDHKSTSFRLRVPIYTFVHMAEDMFKKLVARLDAVKSAQQVDKTETPVD